MQKKRPRYIDVYNDAYRSRKFSGFVHTAIKRFKLHPMHFVNVPLYIERMVQTQSIAERSKCVYGDAEDNYQNIIRWALDLVHFMQRRAGRVLTRAALQFLYHPNGPWLRGQVYRLECEGMLHRIHEFT